MFLPALVLWSTCSVAATSTAPVRIDLDHGFYLMSRPVDRRADEPLPLMICLHGTETTAADILDFWRARKRKLPYVMVAPQGTHAGWRDSDRALMDEFLAHVAESIVFDSGRVLLTGHSAGGAMAFHLVYVEGFPASAVAVTANYVPPTVKGEHVYGHKEVPVFYAVGESDVNRERMREGLSLLRRNGATVTVRRPRIGHVLDPAVGQAAVEWFEALCRDRMDQVLAAAREDLRAKRSPATAAAQLEAIIRYSDTHHTDQLGAVMELLSRVQQSGRVALARAEKLLKTNRPLDARGELLTVERRYSGSSLAVEARRRRARIEAIPEVAELLRLERTIGGATPAPPEDRGG